MYWDAVPDGPGTTLLTAEEDSRAISERMNVSPGISGGEGGAGSTPVSRAPVRRGVEGGGGNEGEGGPTSSMLPSSGMMTANNSTSRPPDRPALSTFIRTDLGPGAAPSASAGSASAAVRRAGRSLRAMGER